MNIQPCRYRETNQQRAVHPAKLADMPATRLSGNSTADCKHDSDTADVPDVWLALTKATAPGPVDIQSKPGKRKREPIFSGKATALKAVAALHPGNSYWTPEPDVSESKPKVTGYRWFIVVCEIGKVAASAAAPPATRTNAGATTCLYGTI